MCIFNISHNNANIRGREMKDTLRDVNIATEFRCASLSFFVMANITLLSWELVNSVGEGCLN